MSNYVNNVNVQNTTYALGPLMSTASGGIVDNKSGAYSSNNNCIIHTSINGNTLGIGNRNLMLDTYVNLGSSATIYETSFIGGSMSLEPSYNCNRNTFINCEALYAGIGGDLSNYNHNTFIGLYTCSANSFNEDILLSGVNNIVQGYAEYLDSGTGFHAVATKTVSLLSYSTTDTGIQFPSNCFGSYIITVLNPTAYDRFNFIVQGGTINSGAYMSGYYTYNSYYYTNSDYIIGVSIDSSKKLCIYTSHATGPTQITISYDVVPNKDTSSSY